jgi:hypothetical protein
MGVMNCQWRSGVACVTLLLGVTACNSGEESAATTSVETAAPTMTVATTSTTVVAATVPITTEAPSTIPPSTTPAATSSPTTSPGDEAAAKAAVIAAAIESTAAFRGARMDPSDTTRLARLERIYSAGAYETVLARNAELVAAEEYLAESSVVAPAYRVDEQSVVIDIAAGSASLNSCEINSWILMTSAGGGAEILDDAVVSVQQVEQFVFEDGSWQFASAQSLNRVEGHQGCDGY